MQYDKSMDEWTKQNTNAKHSKQDPKFKGATNENLKKIYILWQNLELL